MSMKFTLSASRHAFQPMGPLAALMYPVHCGPSCLKAMLRASIMAVNGSFVETQCTKDLAWWQPLVKSRCGNKPYQKMPLVLVCYQWLLSLPAHHLIVEVRDATMYQVSIVSGGGPSNKGASDAYLPTESQ